MVSEGLAQLKAASGVKLREQNPNIAAAPQQVSQDRGTLTPVKLEGNFQSAATKLSQGPKAPPIHF